MKKTKITLEETLQLNRELQQLLKEKIKLSLKFDITTCMNQIKENVESFEKLRIELAQKLGEQKEERFEFSDEKSKQFNEEINALLKKEIEVKCNFKLEHISEIESEYPYHVIFKILK